MTALLDPSPRPQGLSSVDRGRRPAPVRSCWALAGPLQCRVVATSNGSRSAWLRVEGARQNNLKNVSVAIPHDRVTVITGVSGSGKSSLAFDTLFAEGQWRYIESLSTYARMFLERVDRPDVDRIEHIRPAIALEQKNPVRTARSTVGTATELYDYLRLLFARIGRVHCPRCGRGGAERRRRTRWPSRCCASTPERGPWCCFPLPAPARRAASARPVPALLPRGFARVKVGDAVRRPGRRAAAPSGARDRTRTACPGGAGPRGARPASAAPAGGLPGAGSGRGRGPGRGGHARPGGSSSG